LADRDEGGEGVTRERLQHPATLDIWRWFRAREVTMARTRRDHIERTLRELSELLWALDRETEQP
jgi:hypothetical protein